jgi:serine/threonine protein kinase
MENLEKYCPKCFKRFPGEAMKCPDDQTNLVAMDVKDLVGQVLDNRYTVLGRVGKGGMGVVYKAEQHLIKRIVALKVLNRDIVKDETAVKRFLNEARVIASLENPHTVTLYDFGVTTDGLLYYTMELLDGQPLSAIVKRDGPLDYKRAVDLLLQTCESLEEAHDKGILHRDIKPENLFVIRKGGKERVKVLDFGIAKLVGDSSSGESVTKTGMICGTPQYLSPEQVMGAKPVPASDLYSLAIVLYEILAGEPPFYSPTPMKLLLAHLNERPAAIAIKNPRVKVPASIDAFVLKGMAKAPEERFSCVAEFRAALLRAVEEHEKNPQATVNLTGVAVTAAGTRVRVDDGLSQTASFADERTVTASEGFQPDTEMEERPVLGKGKGEAVVSPASSDEPTEVIGERRRRKMMIGIGAGAAVAAVVLALVVLKPWIGEKGAGRSGEQDAPTAHSVRVAPAEGGPEAADAEKKAAEESARVAAEAEAKKKAEEEAKALAEAEAKKKAEEEAKALAEAEAKKKAEEEAKALAEAEAKKKAGSDEKAEARKKAEAEARRKAEAEARKKADEEARRKAEAEAKKKADEEEAKKKGGFKKIGAKPIEEDKKGDGKGFKKIPSGTK